MTLFPRLVLQSEAMLSTDCISRPLVGSGFDREPDLLSVAVAHGYEAGAFLFVSREGPKAALEAMVAQARRGLTATPHRWERFDDASAWFGARILRARVDESLPFELMCTDGGGVDDLSTSALLHPPALKLAADELGASTLLAIVPKRGWLLVRAGGPTDDKAIHQMAALAQEIREDAGRHDLCSAVYFVEDGEVVGGQLPGKPPVYGRADDALFLDDPLLHA